MLVSQMLVQSNASLIILKTQKISPLLFFGDDLFLFHMLIDHFYVFLLGLLCPDKPNGHICLFVRLELVLSLIHI